jgi:hypothetical protein
MTKSQCRKAFEEWLKSNGVNDVSQNQEWLRDALYTAWVAATKNAIHWAALFANDKAVDLQAEIDGTNCVTDRRELSIEQTAIEGYAEELWLRINDLDIEEKTP